eukprot:NODE_322_length_11016_cov_0.249061.p4 type:complete len:259 gc:universal NODE_322_length_11016_cov_0.249061:8563-7787(-)
MHDALDDRAINIIDSFVKGKDLYQVSPKDIRIHVESALGKNFNKKEFIKIVLQRAKDCQNEKVKFTPEKRKISETSKSAAEARPADKKRPKKPTIKIFSSSKINKLDPKLSRVTGYAYLPYSIVMKRVWAYVKDNGLIAGKTVKPDELIGEALDQSEPFNMVTILSQKAKGLMEDVKRDDIPAFELKKTLALLQKYDEENAIELKKKMAKYEVNLKKYEETMATSNITFNSISGLETKLESSSKPSKPALILSSSEDE